MVAALVVAVATLVVVVVVVAVALFVVLVVAFAVCRGGRNKNNNPQVCMAARHPYLLAHLFFSH